MDWFQNLNEGFQLKQWKESKGDILYHVFEKDTYSDKIALFEWYFDFAEETEDNF